MELDSDLSRMSFSRLCEGIAFETRIERIRYKQFFGLKRDLDSFAQPRKGKVLSGWVGWRSGWVGNFVKLLWFFWFFNHL